jgi:uncharacterized protein YndB with AHSA1/START domain
MPICKTIDINAPPERVFPWIADPEKNKQWLPGVESTVFAGDPTRVGTTFVQSIRQGGRVNETPGEVTGYAKDRWYAIRLDGKPCAVTVEYRFEPSDSNGTRLTFTCEFLQPNFVLNLFLRIFSPLVNGMLQKLLEKLKALAEGGEAAGSGWNRGPGM